MRTLALQKCAVIALALAAATACGSGSPVPASPAKVHAPAGSLPIGDTAAISLGTVTVTGMERRGGRTAATLRACVAADAGAPAAFTLGAWSIGTSGGTTVPAVSDEWSGTSDDSVPIGGNLLEPSTCANLLVAFDVAEKQDPVTAVYRNAQGDAVVWALGPTA